ncbi:MAG: hypothetical protein AB9903_04170 [Vulcanimicrobiota bacterium]
MDYPSRLGNPAKVVSIFGSAINTGLHAVIEKVTGAFRTLLTSLMQCLPSSAEDTMEFERHLHQKVAQKCLDPFMGEILQESLTSSAVVDKAEEVIRYHMSHPRLQCAAQEVNITLLGGSTVSVTVPYILNRPPKGPGRPRRKGSRGIAGNGLYPTLEVLGLYFRVSPALAEEVCRLTTLEPLDEVVSLLSHRGVIMNRKVVERISNQIAGRGLAHREFLKEEVALGFRGDAARGKQLVISVDGGRVRTRVRSKRGRKKKNGHRKFKGEWREPKAFVIYEIDDQGDKKQGGLLEYDATMGDADELFERLYVALMAIGAQYAHNWTFIADGGEWIWDRVPQLITQVGFDNDKVTGVLDYYHAMENLYGIADEVLGWSKKRRARWLKRTKRLLIKGRVNEFIAEVKGLCKGRRARRVAKKLLYFEKRWDLMKYASFKKKRIPLGSGAMESCIRRVINLRFKGNGIFWKMETLEGRIHLRAQLLSEKWPVYIPAILEPKAFWGVKTAMKSKFEEAA